MGAGGQVVTAHDVLFAWAAALAGGGGGAAVARSLRSVCIRPRGRRGLLGQAARAASVSSCRSARMSRCLSRPDRQAHGAGRRRLGQLLLGRCECRRGRVDDGDFASPMLATTGRAASPSAKAPPARTRLDESRPPVPSAARTSCPARSRGRTQAREVDGPRHPWPSIATASALETWRRYAGQGLDTLGEMRNALKGR